MCLLHNDNVYAPVPVGHSVRFEDYDDIRMIVGFLKYREHNWVICVNLKMVNFLLGQQKGFSKFFMSPLDVGQSSTRQTLDPEGLTCS